jgi:hypothetical protein
MKKAGVVLGSGENACKSRMPSAASRLGLGLALGPRVFVFFIKESFLCCCCLPPFIAALYYQLGASFF